MSDASSPVSASEPGAAAVRWTDPARHAAFDEWLARIAAAQQLDPASLRVASADASFRRYLRIDTLGGATRIIMDAPPALESCAPFVHVAGLMRDAGLHAPEVLDWNQPQGFMLLTDLGRQTMMDVIDRARPEANRPLYEAALDVLLAWQQASKPGQLPPYDEALLRRELALFPDWYLTRHRGVALEGKLRETLEQAFDLIVARNLAAPMVYVHRDFMPRNLMAPTLPAAHGALPPEGAAPALGRPGGGRMAPTLPAAHGALPPEGAAPALGRPGGGRMAPTLPAAHGALPPEGAVPALGRPGGGRMAPTLPAADGALPPEGAVPALGRPGGGRMAVSRGPLGVLDFQDAVYGPVTYDIASLMRDAFLSWDEEFVLDITVRYWERARKLGLLDFEDWHQDFGSFWRAVEWMGLQRHLKVAGIFARLTLRDGKPKYLADAPRFIGYIRHTAGRYRELAPLLKLVDDIEGTSAVSGWAYGRL